MPTGAANSPAKSDGPEDPPAFGTLLRELARADEALPDPRLEPGAAFRRLFDGWVERGGSERGKPRHSAQRIKSWLGHGNPVRSLETKLAGKTWLQREDAARLLGLFLSRWTYDASTDSYAPYRAGALPPLVDHLLSDLLGPGEIPLLLPQRSRTKSASRAPSRHVEPPRLEVVELGRSSGEVIAELFAESDALITISLVQTILGTNPARSMVQFRKLMGQLYALSRQEDRERALIWIVDIGLRDDRESSSNVLLNVESLATRFRALALTNVPGEPELWDWLMKRVVVLVSSLRRDEIDRCCPEVSKQVAEPMFDLPWFLADRLLLEAPPARWLDTKGLDGAFDRHQAAFWRQPTITAHLSVGQWPIAATPEIDPRIDLRYFYHGLPGESAVTGQSPRCIELGQPGRRWSDGFRLACSAAFWRLGWPDRLEFLDPPEPFAQLRRQGVAVLNLWEFLQLSNNLIASNLNED